MGKANPKGRSKGSGHFVALPEWMLASAAYRSLSPYARCLLVEIKRLYNGANNGDLFMGVRTAAERIDAAKKTAEKAIAELRDRGFIRPAQAGAFNWKNGQATRWVLTEYEHAGKLATKEFMRWKAPAEKQKPVLRRSPDRPTTEDTRPTTYDGQSTDRPTTGDGLGRSGPKSVPPGRTHLSYQDGGDQSDGSSRAERSPRRSEVERGGDEPVALGTILMSVMERVPSPSCAARVGTKPRSGASASRNRP